MRSADAALFNVKPLGFEDESVTSELAAIHQIGHTMFTNGATIVGPTQQGARATSERTVLSRNVTFAHRISRLRAVQAPLRARSGPGSETKVASMLGR